MRNAIACLFLLTVVVLMVLSGCGKECTPGVEVVGRATAAQLLDLACPEGSYVQTPVTTKTLLNGDVVSYNAICVKVRICP